MEKNINCETHSEKITCKNASCKEEIEKSESEAKRYNGHFVKFKAMQVIQERIK